MSLNIRNIGFILLYISIWLSLDSGIYNLSYITYEKFFVESAVNDQGRIYNLSNLNYSYIYNLFISLRFIFPYIIFIILLILFIKDLFLIRLERKFKYVIYLIFFSFFLQAIIPFFNENNQANVTFVITSIILLINLIFFYNYIDLKKIFIIGLTILFFITTIYGSVLIHHLIFNSPNLNLYGMWPHSLAVLQFLSNEVPRSSGISRSSLILMIPLGFYFLVSKKINYKIYLIYIFFTFLMLSTQSRISLFVYSLGIFVFIYYIYLVNKNNRFKEQLKKFFIIILLPIIIWFSCLEILSLSKKSPAFFEFFSDKLGLYENENIDENIDEKYSKLFRTSDKTSFTSQRAKDWRNIIEKNQKYFLGYGALGDRHLINQSASSLYFYNYASGGLLSVFIFLILILRSIYICNTIIFKIYKVPDKNNYLVLSAGFIILFLIIRSIVESSFAVFGIDSLVFFSCYFYLEQCYKKIII